MWLDITSQHTFWAQLGVQRADAPTAVALSPKKRRQGRLDAAGFTQAGLTDFVTRLVSGKLNTYPLQVSLLLLTNPLAYFGIIFIYFIEQVRNI